MFSCVFSWCEREWWAAPWDSHLCTSVEKAEFNIRQDEERDERWKRNDTSRASFDELRKKYKKAKTQGTGCVYRLRQECFSIDNWICRQVGMFFYWVGGEERQWFIEMGTMTFIPQNTFHILTPIWHIWVQPPANITFGIQIECLGKYHSLCVQTQTNIFFLQYILFFRKTKYFFNHCIFLSQIVCCRLPSVPIFAFETPPQVIFFIVPPYKNRSVTRFRKGT